MQGWLLNEMLKIPQSSNKEMQGCHIYIAICMFHFFFPSSKFSLQYLTAHYLFDSSCGYFYSREQVVCLLSEAHRHPNVKKASEIWL